jgi:prepilin-type processing-associated H-X9-DG protein
VQDYDERYPGGGAFYQVNLNGTMVWNTWDLTIQTYMKSYQIVTCPSDAVTPEVTLPTIGRVRRSYAYANYIRQPADPSQTWSGPAPGSPGRTMAAIPAPSLTVMLSERIGSDGTNAISVATYNSFATTQHTREWASEAGRNFDHASVANGAGGRHLGTNNILYADGHVKAMKMAKNGSMALAGHIGDATGTWINSTQDLPQG